VLLGEETRSHERERDLVRIIDRFKRLDGEKLDELAWRDSSLPWHSNSILCWGIIACATSDRNITRTIIFDLVSVASDRCIWS
jgi:hypothetical protein